MSWTQQKQKAPSNFRKVDNPHSFQLQVANGQLQKQLATTKVR